MLRGLDGIQPSEKRLDRYYNQRSYGVLRIHGIHCLAEDPASYFSASRLDWLKKIRSPKLLEQ